MVKFLQKIFLFFTIVFAWTTITVAQQDSTVRNLPSNSDSTDAFLPLDSVSNSLNQLSDTTILSDSTSTSISQSADSSENIIDDYIAEDTIQQEIRDIEITFIKHKVEQSADSIYFNICKITNTTQKDISGNFRVHIPNGWHLIANPSMKLTLKPKETINLPIRLSIPREAVGGMAYVIDASMETKDGYYSGTTFIKIPLKVKWDLYLNTSTIYFNEYFESVTFDVYVKNEGNAPELLNLQFDVGKLLDVVEVNESKKDYFIKVPPKTDTVFTYTVVRAQLTEDKRQYYKRIWDESTIKIKAISGHDDRVVRQTIWVRDLENQYWHERQEKNSPLNLDFRIYNLLSATHPKLNTRAFGEILFKGPHSVDYVFQARNLLYPQRNSLTYFQNPYNYTMRIQYYWSDKLKAELGEIYNNTMHAVRGWGIKAKYNLTKNDQISASYIIGKYYPMWSSSLMYSRQFKKIRAWAGGTYEDNSFIHYKALSPEVGALFSPAKNHTIRLGLLGTSSTFDNNQGVGTPLDSTIMGFSYMASYTGVWKKFRFGGSTRNDQFNIIRIKPANKIYGYMRYMINQKSRINFITQYSDISTTGYVYSPYYNGSYNRQIISRLTYLNRITGNFILEAGPMFRELNRLLVLDDTVSMNFANYFGGVFVLSRIKFDEFQMLTPSLSAGYTYFRNHLAPDVIIKEQPTINLGLSYINRNMGASANYIYGPNFFVGQNFFSNNIPVNYETVQARVYHTKRFFAKNIVWRNYATYFLRLPSNRQNFVVSSALNFKMPKGWYANLRANLYTNSTDEENQGVITHRNFGMNIGAGKSFDIPQPRIRYYDINILCFNDMNGNGVRDKDEPLLSNIKMLISRDREKNTDQTIRFGEQELVSNTNGEIILKDIPQGAYKLTFEPLFNLGNLYNAKGDEQEIEVISDMDYYVPYVESYQVNGQVRLIRDEFSDKGLIQVNGVRVEATNAQGETFAALTDQDGFYTLNVPQAGYFTVKVNNVFGEGFEIDKDKFLIQFNGFKHYTVDFTFYEGKREVNFGNGEQFFNFKSITSTNDSTPKDSTQNNETEQPVTDENKEKNNTVTDNTNQQELPPLNVAKDAMQPKNELIKDLENIAEENKKYLPVDLKSENYNYLLELGMIEEKTTVNYQQALAKLSIEPTPIKVNGVVLYASKVLPNKEEAKDLQAELNKIGFTESVVVAVYQGKIIILEE